MNLKDCHNVEDFRKLAKKNSGNKFSFGKVFHK